MLAMKLHTKRNKMASSKEMIKVVSNTMLIATMENNSDVQLRQNKNEWWMISKKTGIHMIVDNELSERVTAHWTGFKQNQL